MKTVKKYTSFEDLKSSEKRPEDYKVSLKKHNAFEKILKAIYSIKHHKNTVQESK